MEIAKKKLGMCMRWEQNLQGTVVIRGGREKNFSWGGGDKNQNIESWDIPDQGVIFDLQEGGITQFATSVRGNSPLCSPYPMYESIKLF